MPLNVSKLAAPFIPFLSDAIYRELRRAHDPESVHLCDYPTYYAPARDGEILEQEMSAVKKVVSAGDALRKEQKIKVRQPLPKAFAICPDSATLESLRRQGDLIADELNVKQIAFYSDESEFVALSAKPNFRILGKKVGSLMQAAQKAISSFSQRQLQQLLSGKPLIVVIEEQEIILTPEDVAVERKVKEGLIAQTAGDITVALDTTLNEDLLLEGLARELVNKINTMRRDEGYAVVDRITVHLDTTPRVRQSFDRHRDYITREVLATAVFLSPAKGKR